MRNTIIDNFRGLCMLGVLGIHVGSLSINTDSFILFSFLEILSRYSVPTFFFISGYGLFCHAKQESYIDFMKKRLRSAGLPYLFWSILYQIYFTFILPPGTIHWDSIHVIYILFFGLGCYHLYFMVILLWFYALQPLWRKLVTIINKNLLLGLSTLFIFQLSFYWLSAYSNINPKPWSEILQYLFKYRINYIPLYYLFIFILGAIIALHWDSFIVFLRKNAKIVLLAHASVTAYFLYCAWTSYTLQNYTFLQLAITYQQFSYQGFLYTITSIITFCLVLDYLKRKSPTSKTLNGILRVISTLSAYSTLIYFVHPLFLDMLAGIYFKLGWVYTSKKIFLLYFLLLVVTLLASFLLTKLLSTCKLFRLFLTGK